MIKNAEWTHLTVDYMGTVFCSVSIYFLFIDVVYIIVEQ